MPVRARCLAEALERLRTDRGGLTAGERRRARAARGLGAGRRPRWRVLLEAGSPPAEVARECGVSVRTVERWRPSRAGESGGVAGRGWFPVSAIEISRREQAASSTRDHVRRVAVTAYGAVEQQEPIEGFHGLSRPVLDEPAGRGAGGSSGGRRRCRGVAGVGAAGPRCRPELGRGRCSAGAARGMRGRSAG